MYVSSGIVVLNVTWSLIGGYLKRGTTVYLLLFLFCFLILSFRVGKTFRNYICLQLCRLIYEWHSYKISSSREGDCSALQKVKVLML